jgi:hypothetical protein
MSPFGPSASRSAARQPASSASLLPSSIAYLVWLPEIKFSFLNRNLMAATDHLPILNCDSVDRYVVGGFMATRTRLARASVSILLAAGILTAAQDSGDAQEPGKVGPPLETVKTFGDDFRLIGIGVSAEGRVFATAPSSNVRSRFSMIEVDPKTDSVTPYPDAAHLWEVAFNNNLPRSGPFTIFKVKLPH